MKSLALALLLGAVSPTSLNKEQTIWDESESFGLPTICDDQWLRWAHPSNSWDSYKMFSSGKFKMFKDDSFDADWSSLYSKEFPPHPYTVKNYHDSVVGWKRPSEIYPGEEVHLKGKLEAFAPHGIKQGSVGDCWFLAGAAALAEDATRMWPVVDKNSRENYSPYGIFRYYFWVKNKWVPINIDDRLPLGYKYSNSKDYITTYASGRSTFGAWWMPLFEKAFSKLNGNYDRIVGGSGLESLRMLSGKPTYFIKHREVAKFEKDEFKLFHKFAKENYPMVLSCCDTAGNAPDGLQNAHAYTLLDVVEIPGGHKLAKIRNPWSSEGYNGEWSDKDPRWTPELLKQVGHEKANDGVFFMPFHNILNAPYFRSTTVNIHKEFTNTKIYDIVQKVQQMSITINIPSKQVIYFTIEAQNPRFEKQCAKQSNYIVNTFFFKGTRFTGMDNLLFGQGFMGQGFYHSTAGKPDYVFDAGTYTMMVYNFACQGTCTPLEYSLTVYQEGSGTVSINY